MSNKKAATFCVLALLSCVCAVCAFAAHVPYEPSLQREFVILNNVHPYDLNPHTASYATEAQVFTGLYEGLFSYNPFSLEPEPALAESFKISRDKLTWTFTIRKNAYFSNGKPITAETFKTAWLMLLSPEANAPFASLLDCIKGAEAYRTGKAKNADGVAITVKNAETLVVKLNAPTEHFSKILCHHAFSAVNETNNAYSGPFVLSEYGADSIVLTKNTRYWDADSVALPSIRFVLSDDTEENTFLFNTGRIDWLSGSADTSKVLDRKAIMISAQFGTEYLFFKTQSGPFADSRVRNALVYALPEEALRGSSLIQARSLILPLRGYPEIYGSPESDLDEARRLLAEAGYDTTAVGIGGNSGVSANGGKKLTVTLCFTDDDSSKNRAALLSDAWAKVGVQTVSKFLPATEYIGALKTTDADLFSYIWIGDFADPLAFLELFRGTSSLNETGWKNGNYDALLQEAAKTADVDARYKKLSEAEQLLLDEAVIIPVSHTVSLNVVDSQNVAGWFDNALDIHPLKYLRFIKAEPLPRVALIRAQKRIP